MWEKLKGAGVGILGFAMGILCIAMLFGLFTNFIKGGVWLCEKIYPWLLDISKLTLEIVVIICLPLAIFHKTRAFAANIMMIASFVFGTTLWVWGLLLTYHIWGVIAVFIGLFLLGIGVVPIAMIATLIKGMWLILIELLILTILTFGTGFAGSFIGKKVYKE